MSDKQQERMTRSFPLFSNGEHPDIDALQIVVQLLEEMEYDKRMAAIGYIKARWD